MIPFAACACFVYVCTFGRCWKTRKKKQKWNTSLCVQKTKSTSHPFKSDTITTKRREERQREKPRKFIWQRCGRPRANESHASRDYLFIFNFRRFLFVAFFLALTISLPSHILCFLFLSLVICVCAICFTMSHALWLPANEKKVHIINRRWPSMRTPRVRRLQQREKIRPKIKIKYAFYAYVPGSVECTRYSSDVCVMCISHLFCAISHQQIRSLARKHRYFCEFFSSHNHCKAVK